jgi:nucleotide-binding universal stress UspA family protein
VPDNVEFEITVKGGRATSDIVKYAKENQTDLIVIATHGLTGLEHMLLGSVTEKVVRMAHCPVFTVKSFSKHLVD